MNSREKGKRGERECAKALNELGFNTRRSQQFCGINGDADVIGIPGIHIEVKRVEHLNHEAAMQQAKRDAREDEIPVVIHRKNNGEWVLETPLKTSLEFAKRWKTDS